MRQTSNTKDCPPPRPPLAFVVGTRPEAIKLAPVIIAARNARLFVDVISTGQQADLVGPALADFGLSADLDLHVMRPGQSLSDLASRCITGVARRLRETRPGMVVVQGDTSSAAAGALAGFYERVPVAHVEAGLRTHDLASPFPEEANRQLISRVARLHFAPTLDAKANLLAEGIDASLIDVTGNTVVDALNMLRPRIRTTRLPIKPPAGRLLVLVTVHRRENLGRPLDDVCRAIRKLTRQRPELHFVFIRHPNPAVARAARARLANRPNISLVAPLPYLEMLRLVSESWLILTDSGGLQEEAPSFRRPVLVLRDRTERVEGLASGGVRLVGTDPRNIISEVLSLLDARLEHSELALADNPYGDGRAAQRIVAAICEFVGRTNARCENCRRRGVAPRDHDTSYTRHSLRTNTWPESPEVERIGS